MGGLRDPVILATQQFVHHMMPHQDRARPAYRRGIPPPLRGGGGAVQIQGGEDLALRVSSGVLGGAMRVHDPAHHLVPPGKPRLRQLDLGHHLRRPAARQNLGRQNLDPVVGRYQEPRDAGRFVRVGVKPHDDRPVLGNPMGIDDKGAFLEDVELTELRPLRHGEPAKDSGARLDRALLFQEAVDPSPLLVLHVRERVRHDDPELRVGPRLLDHLLRDPGFGDRSQGHENLAAGTPQPAVTRQKSGSSRGLIKEHQIELVTLRRHLALRVAVEVPLRPVRPGQFDRHPGRVVLRGLAPQLPLLRGIDLQEQGVDLHRLPARIRLRHPRPAPFGKELLFEEVD